MICLSRPSRGDTCPVKIRTSTFFTRTKSVKLPAPTTDPVAVAAHARVVLNRFELFRPVRLLGVRGEAGDAAESH